ncbi:ligase-associated DNA damage response endonuclease PdeM [Aquimarina gracilis]
MLLIADVHLGKVTHFRKHGSAVPQSAIQHNFDQLNTVLQHFQPEVLCFLGDLFHSYLNSEWIIFAEWANKIESKIILVSGNHDIISPIKYEELDIHVTDAWKLGSIYLTHEPKTEENFFNVSGHVHPGVRLRGTAKQSLSIPCFLKKPNQMILPSFGTFTGKHIVTPTENDQIFAIAHDEVIEII